MRGFIDIDTYCGRQIVNLAAIERVQAFGEDETELILSTCDYQLDDMGQRYYAQNRLVCKETYRAVLRKMGRASR